MCGIIGKISQNQIDIPVFNQCRDILSHRGPDGFGTWVNEEGSIALGHRRLSLIDLSENGAQPMTDYHRRYVITYNGEIYNYRAIRDDLQELGYVFHSDSDTEVLLLGYIAYGPGILKRINGMFAFAIWDDLEHEIFMARDPFGIKPLYYARQNGNFWFASEIKAIVADPDFTRKMDLSAVSDFLVYRYVPHPKTIWEDISKLPAAHYAHYKSGSHFKIEEYWRLDFDNIKVDESEAVYRVDKLLSDSVAQHIVADVKVGSFLSGGYDSSAIVSYLHHLSYKTDTFSIGFSGWENSEHKYAEIVASYFDYPNFTTLIQGDTIGMVEELSSVYDEPLADISIIPTYLVSQLAVKNVKAVLSGEGGDEIFGGYSWQKAFFHHFGRTPFLRRIVDCSPIWKEPVTLVEYENGMEMGRFDRKELNMALHDSVLQVSNPDHIWFYRQHYQSELSPLKSIQYLDMKCFMQELILTKMDRASMANSLEVRVPFLSRSLFEWVFSLAEKNYFKPGVTKFLLHSNLRNRLPDIILNRPKQGFVGPDIFYQNINWYHGFLKKSRLSQHGIVREEYIRKLIHDRDHWRLWKLTVLESWMRKWYN